MICFYQLSDSIIFKIKLHFFPLMSARNANAFVWDSDVIQGRSWWADPRHFMEPLPALLNSEGVCIWVSFHMSIWCNSPGLPRIHESQDINIIVYCEHRSGFPRISTWNNEPVS